MKIVLIRHGEPDYVHDSLTEKGFREAEILADRISALNVKQFYCSPLGRAKKTAEPTLKRLNRDAITYDWLQEFPGRAIEEDTGNRSLPWDYMPADWTKRDELFNKDIWYEEKRMKTGDVKEAYFNIKNGIDTILSEFGYKRDRLMYRCKCGNKDTIVLFCHLGTCLSIVSHLIGVAAPVLWQSVFLAPTSVTTLVSEERIPGEVFFRAISIGDISHLYLKNEPMSMSGFFDESISFELHNKTDY